MSNRPRQHFMGRLWNHIMLLFTFLSALWLGVCFAASYISDLQIPYLSLFSLTAPFAVIVNIFFIVFWLLIGKFARCLLPLLALVLCYRVPAAVFGLHLNSKNNFAKTGSSVKVMSWNVHGMGLFGKTPARTAGEIDSVIKNEAPDILFLAEYSTTKHDSTQPYSSAILAENGFNYFRYCGDNTFGKHISLGNAMFSRYPIVAYMPVHLNRSIYMLQCDIQLPNKKIMRFFFVHLFSFNLTDNDRKYLSEVKAKGRIGRADIHHSRFYMSRFNYSYVERALEADTIAQIISRSPYPVFICGDFNDLPASYTYTTIRGGLTDAFLQKRFGLGRTYNELFFTLRIDHMLYDPRFLDIIGFKSPWITLSDHNPIIANFEIKR